MELEKEVFEAETGQGSEELGDGGVRVGLARGVFEGDWGLRDLVVGREGEQSPAASGAFPQVMYSSQHCTNAVHKSLMHSLAPVTTLNRMHL